MNGQHLVDIEIIGLKRKLAGIGGKNLGPSAKVAEVNDVLERIKNIRRNQKSDAFFSSQQFKNAVQWLEHIRAGGEE